MWTFTHVHGDFADLVLQLGNAGAMIVMTVGEKDLVHLK